MAKIKLGPMVGQAAGSIGATVFSHNRFGTYIRRRATPTNTQSNYRDAIKAILELVSKAWKTASANQQSAWNTWATNNPFVDILGDSQNLTGHQAFVKLNAVARHLGFPVYLDPPAVAAPSALTTCSLVADIGVGGVQITFAPSPLEATEVLEVRAAVVDSAGISYVRNLYKYVMGSGMAAITPLHIKSAVEDRFGTLAVGQILHVMVNKCIAESGLVSMGRTAHATVVST